MLPLIFAGSINPLPVLAEASLRVCADPDNLPYSNSNLAGYENKIAEILAADLNKTVEYTWYKQRQNFFRQTLDAERCDLVLSVPSTFERVLTTKPYYCSHYVWVSKRQRAFDFQSFDDPRLKQLLIGVHTVGGEGAASPPVMALSRHGLNTNIVGFSLWGEQSEINPQARVIDAVINGDIDTALVWGPFAGYFAKQYGDILQLAAVNNDDKSPEVSFAYAISMGVRKNDQLLLEQIEHSINRQRKKIIDVLHEFNMPLSDACKVAI